MHLSFFHSRPNPPGASLMMGGLFFTLTGVAILSAPDLLAYFVATLLIIVGIVMLQYGWKMKKWR